MMHGVGNEAAAFFQALKSGAGLYLLYAFIGIFRKIVPHGRGIVEIEDFLYWIFTGFFLFKEMFYTSDGSIRWFFVLGVVLGVILSAFVCAKGKNNGEKYIKRYKKRTRKVLIISQKKFNINMLRVVR